MILNFQYSLDHIRKKNWFIQLMKKPGLQLSIGTLCLIISIACFAPYIAPYNPSTADFQECNSPPSLNHWMGTDYLGRDLLSRMIYGARTTLFVTGTVITLSCIIGFMIGSFAGYNGGLPDESICRCIDIFLVFPGIIFAIVFLGIFGSGIINLIIAITLTHWVIYARLSRGLVLSMKNEDFISAARQIGLPTRKIIIRHILPNIIPTIIVYATLDVGHVILAIAALNFLGLGTPANVPEWGSILSSGKDLFQTTPHIILVSGIVISLTVLIANIIGEGLRDLLDPIEREHLAL